MAVIRKAKSDAEIAAAAEKLKAKVLEFFAVWEEKEKFPSYPSMRVYLGYTKDDIEKLCERPEYRKVFMMAQDMREAWLAEHSVDSKYAAGCKNLLLQPENGGLSDKSQNLGSELKITIKGQGTDESLFD